MGEQSAAEEDSRPSRRFAWLRRLDDLFYRGEQAVLVTFLIAMTVMVFVDVVFRRLTAPESKVGEILAKLAGVSDAPTRALLDTAVAPILSAALGLGILWFAYFTAERHRGAPLLPIPYATVVLTGLTAAVLTFLGWLMIHPNVESRYFYILLYVMAAGAYIANQVRQRPPGWKARAILMALLVSPLFIYFAARYFPVGFTWSKEMSLILLLWVGFLGASVAVHEGKHLRMEAFDKLLPPVLAAYLRAVGFLLTAAFCAFMAILGTRYVYDPVTGTLALGAVFEQSQVPDWVATTAVPLGFALAAVRFVAAASSSLLGGSYGQPQKEASLREAEAHAQREGRATGEDAEAPS